MNKVTIRDDQCKGCGLCVSVCPKRILKISDHRLNAKGFRPAEVIDIQKCIACAFCATICPDVVIEVEKDA